MKRAIDYFNRYFAGFKSYANFGMTYGISEYIPRKVKLDRHDAQPYVDSLIKRADREMLDKKPAKKVGR